jgi:hypothetical protein
MKTVESPITRFPGSVVLKDPIPLSACVAWEEALNDCKMAPCPEAYKILVAGQEKPDPDPAEFASHILTCKNCRPALSDTAAQERMVKAVKSCVDEWNIPSFDLANPPGSPRIARSKFVAWIIGEINTIYNEAEPDGDPNA